MSRPIVSWPAGRWWVPVVAAATAVALLLGALVMVAVRASGGAVAGQVEARAADATTSAQAFVDGRVDVLNSLVESYARRPALIQAVGAGRPAGPETTELTSVLGEFARAVPGLVATWATDEHGVVIDNNSHSLDTIGDDFSFRDWYQGAVRTGSTYLSAGYVNKDRASTPGFAISTVVRAQPDGPVIGVIGASMSLAAFQDVLAPVAPHGGRMMITDQEGQVIAAYGMDLPPLHDISDVHGVATALAGDREVRHGSEWIDVYAPLREGWGVSTSLPGSLAADPQRRLTGTLALTGSAVGLLLLAVLLLLARLMRQRAATQAELQDALAQLDERQRYTETVLDTLDVAVAVCDAQGELTYFNRLSREWHGLDADNSITPDEWSGRYAVTHMDGATVSEQEWPLVRAIATREPASAELVLHRPDHPSRQMIVHARPLLSGSGSLVGAVAGSHDVTLLRLREGELSEARDTAMEAVQAKARFLAAVSHEIRTPLNGVLGMLELTLLDELPEAQRQRLSIAADSGATLLALLNDVLDLSRSDAGRLELTERPCDLPELVGSTSAILSGAAERKGLTLDVRVGDSVPKRVLTDPARLTQVLLNLVSNAVKFTDRGFVTVTAEADAPDLAGRCEVAITVEDSGAGMSASEVETVFQPFVQGGAGRRSGGTGLGLALTTQILDLMGGSVAVTSRPGRGSSFTVKLPVVAAPALETAPADVVLLVPQPRERPLRVLVAEDNVVNQLVVRGMLESLGAEVTVVDDGRAALSAATRDAPAGFDLVILDWQMPVMDGPEAATALRAAGVRVPIVGLTARTTVEDAEACRAAGMDSVLIKPCSVAALEKALQEVGLRR